jgi:hypothetical protein
LLLEGLDGQIFDGLPSASRSCRFFLVFCLVKSKAAVNPYHAFIESIHAVCKIHYARFEVSYAEFQVAYILGNTVNGCSDIAEVFQYDAVFFGGHPRILPFSLGLNNLLFRLNLPASWRVPLSVRFVRYKSAGGKF